MNAEVEVEVLLAGEMTAPGAYLFRPPGAGRLARVGTVVRGHGGAYRTPILAFVVRHPSAGIVLVDTGLHPDALENLRGDFGRFLGYVFRSLRPAGQPFDEQLSERGIAASDVQLVVMTHLHVDHTGGMRLLPNAEFVCSRQEWKAATGRRASLSGYAANHLPEESRMRLVDVERDGEPHGAFTRTLDLLGDGSVRFVSTPGHSHGHCSVLVRTAGGRQVLLAGDAAYTLRNIREQRLPAFTADDDRSLRSLRAIKAFMEQEPDALVVPTHDPDAWRRLAAPAPEGAYERTPR